MKFTKLAVAIAALSAGTAFAAPTFSYPGGSADPFGGIDWSGNGTAFTTDFNQAQANAGGTFTFNTTFFAYANPGSGITAGNGVAYIVPNLISGDNAAVPNGFELTTVARFNETGSCNVGGSNCVFSINSGTFDIYLDNNPNAKTGATATLGQYTDGTRIIGGTVSSGTSNFTTTSNGGSGVVSLLGSVNFTNSAYITPGLMGTSATATLQVGAFNTGYQRPTGIVGASDTCTSSGTGTDLRACSVSFQADANQSFSASQVPAPGTLALLGAAVAGLGFTARRRSAR